jgi:hypothetical protein
LEIHLSEATRKPTSLLSADLLNCLLPRDAADGMPGKSWCVPVLPEWERPRRLFSTNGERAGIHGWPLRAGRDCDEDVVEGTVCNRMDAGAAGGGGDIKWL